MGYLLGFILFLYLIHRIGKLEQKVEEMQGGRLPASLKTVPSPVASAPPLPSPLPSKPAGTNSFFSWYARDWPLKTGAVFILLGFAWLVTYAFLNNWVGPAGRILFGLLSGSLILTGGERRLKTSRQQGIIVTLLGASIILVTIYAAQTAYHMFPPEAALALAALTMVLTAVISLMHNDSSLVVGALVIGGLAPLLTGSTTPSVAGLYGYLLAVTAGSIWVVYHRNWKHLLPLAIIMVSAYSGSYFTSSTQHLSWTLTPWDTVLLQFFAITFTTLFYGASVVHLLRTRTASRADLTTAFLIGLFAVGWINGLAPEHLKAMLTLAVCLAFMIPAFVVSRNFQLPQVVYVYTGVAVGLLAIASAYAFDGPVLAIAFAVEAAVVPVIATQLLGQTIGMALLWYFLLPFLISFPSFFGSDWETGVFHNDFYALFATTISLLGTGWYFRTNPLLKNHTVGKTSAGDAATALVVTGGVYALVLLWLVCHAAIDRESLATGIVLFLYTVTGLYLYMRGEKEGRKIMRSFGFVLVLFVIARLLIVEIWSMQLAFRIVTFFAIGALFIGSVLLRKPGGKHL